MNELVTLKKIEQSKLAIREVKNLDEIKKISDQGAALKAYAQSQKMSAEIIADINVLQLTAERRLGEITANMGKAKSNQYKKVELPPSGKSKIETLANAGIDIRRANEAEKITEMEEDIFNELLEVKKDISRKEVVEVAKLPKEKQKAVIKKIKCGEVSDVKTASKKVNQEERAVKKGFTPPAELPKDCRLFTADINKHIDINDNSIDFIITDPPYPKEYIPLYGKLSKLASRVLKNGGSLIVMCGQSYLPEVINELCKYMNYHWTMAYITPGGQSPSLWQKNTNTFWKPVLWFTKGKYKGDFIGDVLKSPPNDNDKKYHEWGQSLNGFREIIEKFTYPKQTIYDPFIGGGTTGVAAVSMDRKFIGSDIDPKNIEVSRERILEVLCKK